MFHHPHNYLLTIAKNSTSTAFALRTFINKVLKCLEKLLNVIAFSLLTLSHRTFFKKFWKNTSFFVVLVCQNQVVIAKGTYRTSFGVVKCRFKCIESKKKKSSSQSIK